MINKKEDIKNKSPKINFIYNLLYQILILIIPLITIPYLSRVIGATGVGIYSYTYSIVYYFMLLCLMGVNNYGNRTIAKVRDDKNKLSITFWSIYFLQLIMGIIMIFLYLLYIYIIGTKYTEIALIQILFIISSILDINWLFFGLEEFKKTITRNTIIKIITVILIFLFVKRQEDLWVYTLIISGMTVLSNLVLWGFIIGKIDFVKIKFNDILIHIKPNLILFIPVIAVSLYKIMDKIMLGNMSNVTEVGFYENAEKISQIPMTIVCALGTVMLPRISNIISNGEEEKAKNYMEKSIKLAMFMAFSMCIGLICIGNNFATFYFGKEFEKSGILIMLLSITIPFFSFANVIRTQYLIPKEKDKIYIISVIIGAIINLIMNLIFIPLYESIGACIGTIAAEFAVAFYQVIAVKKEISIGKYIKDSTIFLIKSLIMFIIIYPLNFIKTDLFIKMFMQILIGVFVYGILNIKYINSLINFKRIFKKIDVKK